MSIITLTTDWNARDYYVGTIKGKILSRCNNVTIVDISHQVQAFNINLAAFIIRNCFYNFPPGSIHIIAVNMEGGKEHPYLAILYEGHYFLSTDNGIFGLICTENPDKIIKITITEPVTCFSGLSVFADTACKLCAGEKIDALGTSIHEFSRKTPIRAVIEESVINGSVIYVDSYRNAITNITKDLFERVGKNRPFEIYVQSNYYKIRKINKFYNETSPGEILALFNSVGLLEIAINSGKAADLLNLSINSNIRIKFQ
jgi:S-adenosylmethionine hydrolase